VVRRGDANADIGVRLGLGGLGLGRAHGGSTCDQCNDKLFHIADSFALFDWFAIPMNRDVVKIAPQNGEVLAELVRLVIECNLMTPNSLMF
jgi:hypothetical protein